MDRFDLIVVGSGAGTHVASKAAEEGLNVAFVDKGPTGGTCLNTGCIPSKMLIYPADVIRTLQAAKAVGVEGSITGIDFNKIMRRMHSVVDETRNDLEEAIKAKENVTWYRATGEFVGDYTLKAGDDILTAPKIVIATGSRPLVPPIKGLKEAGYLDNATLLDLKELPKSLIIIGAGYIGCEYGHFFSAIGTEVTLLGRSASVLDGEEPEVCNIVKVALSENLKLHTNHEVVEVQREGEKKIVTAHNRIDDRMYEFKADEVLLAAGRRSNADLLKPEMTGVQTDERGWIKVNDYLETNIPGIWALGDALGKYMFRHTANYESDLVVYNLLRAKDEDDREKADYHAVPHAVFTYPQVGSVGLTEKEALEKGHSILVGRAKYTDVAKGVAMAEDHGFAKVIVREDTGRILGCSVVGSEAPVLVQQIVYLMNTEYQDLLPLIRSQVIHPTLSEAIVEAFGNLEHPYHHHAEKEDSGKS